MTRILRNHDDVMHDLSGFEAVGLMDGLFTCVCVCLLCMGVCVRVSVMYVCL